MLSPKVIEAIVRQCPQSGAFDVLSESQPKRPYLFSFDAVGSTDRGYVELSESEVLDISNAPDQVQAVEDAFWAKIYPQLSRSGK